VGERNRAAHLLIGLLGVHTGLMATSMDSSNLAVAVSTTSFTPSFTVYLVSVPNFSFDELYLFPAISHHPYTKSRPMLLAVPST
jgi:hypothetical protein